VCNDPIMRHLVRALWVTIALLVLLETWLWDHLRPVVAWIVARIPWAAFKARVGSWIEGLPPYPTLLVFLVPVVLLLPLKFVGLWMLAHGFWLGALGVLALAKVVSLGVTAFIFELTRPKLLELAWFRWFYQRMIGWLAWAHGLVDPIKRRLRTYFRAFAPKRAGRTLRLLGRIRRRMQAERAAA